MKVAIPTFGDRVSPRFDCANTFLVVTLERDEIVHGRGTERRRLGTTRSH